MEKITGNIDYNIDVVRKKNMIQRALMAASKDPVEWVNQNASYFKEIVERDPEVLHYADHEITEKERLELMKMIEDHRSSFRKAA